MAIKNVILGTSETEIIKAGTTLNTVVMSIIFCNTSSTSTSITIYCYPTGSAASDATTIVKQLPIAPTETYIWSSGKFMLSPNDKISAIASNASSITVTPNFVEMEVFVYA